MFRWAEPGTTRATSSRPTSSSRCRISSWSRPYGPTRGQITNRRWDVGFTVPKHRDRARRTHRPPVRRRSPRTFPVGPRELPGTYRQRWYVARSRLLKLAET
ncbi:hypothetical protein FNJ62_04420 [Streptomyces benahoarensis]|uniref:Uncharacterized protein n=1 Tax=Streptomyces benahoarensis TaxID=2595054 RepID=A0A553ZQQ7_9ACTN|nr:hypothetical protein FNJ62_04420 [Streptomyces benahoarensis]TSB43753.1 hypothetical protein FNZ23_02700 [Streptomyces benahoarensis]